jgi:serine/threonine protein phosphatase PrpC
MTGHGLVCPSCGRTVSPDDNFCEACRTELAPAASSGGRPGDTAACPSCPQAQVTEDGYCESCGRRVPSTRDHTELNLGLLAGVTDRGLRHHQNEDAMALATAQDADGPVVLAVVCDGVSSSSRPAEASLLAAQTAMGELLAAVRTGEDLLEASAAAVASAQQKVAALAGPGGDAPSATFVSAVMTARRVTVCWLGDSRAYWLASGPDAVAQRLTTDDSLAEELVATGLLSAADALASPHAHVVTRWVGADADKAEPHVSTFDPPGPGVIMLCSDGLWNYQPEAEDLAARALPRAQTDPLGAAAALVTFALDAGGHDNITVVLAPFPPVRPDPTPTLPIDLPVPPEQHAPTVPIETVAPPETPEPPASAADPP